MRLVNMDVDRIGTNEHCHVGPLSPGLNAISGPRGSGKSTLLRWLRTIALENAARERYPELANADTHSHASSPLSGIVEIENRGYQYRVTADRNGRIRFDSRTDSPLANDVHRSQRWDGRVERQAGSNITETQREVFVQLAASNGKQDSEAALEQLANRLGITGATSSLSNSAGREQLVAREREIESRLSRIEHLTATRESLLARQRQLEAELSQAGSGGRGLRYEGQSVETRRLGERYAAIEIDLQNTLREIEELDRLISNKQAELKLLEVGSDAVTVGESYRAQLQQLDDRLNRWRQTLRDLKSHRETIEHNATDARLDKQIGDQLSSTKDSDPRAAMRSLEAQIMNTRRQLDSLVDRYTTVPGYDYRSASAAVSGTGYLPHEAPHPQGVYRDASGRTYVGHSHYLPETTELPETLRSMQKDLHEVCQQLARHEAKSATETLKQQSMQLKRCEVELLQSVEKLIEERATLLRTIANEHHMSIEQLTLAFGEWCQCHDHPHLHDWLMSEESNCPTTSAGGDPVARQRLLEEIESLKQQRKNAHLRRDDCQRQIRDADLHRRGTLAHKAQPVGRHEAEITRELQQVATDLVDLADRDQLRIELDRVRSELRAAPNRAVQSSRFRGLTDTHIAGLMGPNRYMNSHETRQHDSWQRRYDLVDGIVNDFRGPEYQTDQRAVPNEIVRTAMRMAIVETMMQRGEPVCMIIDEALDSVPADIQASAVAHLASFANGTQQVVVLTEDHHVCDLVKNHRGWVGRLQSTPVRDRSIDVNGQLTALANDHEADKWYQPVYAPRETRPVRNEYFLNDRSLIEDLPSIDPAIAARCRALGVDRIGDLLDVDPHWLAENLRIDGVTQTTVSAWQSAASLLCSVRNLRPFDARVLVGAGVQSSSQLAAMHPSQLLDRVERFLATNRGRKILNSGNSYELSRITSWIASAKGGGRRYDRTNTVRDTNDYAAREYRNGRSRSPSRTSNRDGRHANDYANEAAGYDAESYGAFDEDAYERDARDRDYRVRDYERGYESTSRSRDSDRDRNGSSRSGAQRSSHSRSGSGRSRRSSSERTRSYPVINRNGSSTRSRSDYEPREYTRRERDDREPRERDVVRVSQSSESESGSQLRFYLELSSPVVDAPSIGPRMASKLEVHGIITVDQLLAANPDSLADKLNHRRVDADTIRAWQEQARLVCRIPNLRGHDAQLLVECELTSPEALASMDPETVLAQVSEVAQSKEGQRILRGSKDPDLAEVTDWIAWAASCRSLNAA